MTALRRSIFLLILAAFLTAPASGQSVIGSASATVGDPGADKTQLGVIGTYDIGMASVQLGSQSKSAHLGRSTATNRLTCTH